MKKVVIAVGLAATMLLGLAGPATAKTGNQRFVFVNVNDKTTVTASGVINAVGTHVDIDENHGKFVFRNGTLFVSHVDTSSSESFNERSCTGRFRGAGNFTITGGTGAYAGAQGSGTHRFNGTFAGKKTATGCQEEGGTFSFVVRARGTLTLPG